jgi:hypothetical protein
MIVALTLLCRWIWQNTDCALVELSLVHLLLQYVQSSQSLWQFMSSSPALLAVLVSFARQEHSHIFCVI